MARLGWQLLVCLASAAASTFNDRASLKTAVDLWTSDRASAEAQYGSINPWGVSGVQDMSELFYYNKLFNDDIDDWDTSSVTSLWMTFFVRPAPPLPLRSLAA